MKRTKPTTKTLTAIGRVDGRVTFRKEPSLKLEVIGVYIGRIRVACISHDPESHRNLPYVLQCYLPMMPTIIGRQGSRKEAKRLAIEVAKTFLNLLNTPT